MTFERNPTRRRARLGHGTFVLVLATLLAALSMFFASAADVGAMLTPDVAAARRDAAASAPVELPAEWVWRGRKPIDLEFMYGNREAPRQDWIRVHRDD